MDPILKDRPNVTPWFTNEEEDEIKIMKVADKHKSVFLSSYDELVDTSMHTPNDGHKKDSDIEVIESSINRSKDACTVDEYDSLSIESHHIISSHHNSPNVSNLYR